MLTEKASYLLKLKYVIVNAVILLLLTGTFSKIAHAAAATTSVSINFPEMIALYYVGSLELDFTNPETSETSGTTQNTTATIPLNSSQATVDAGLDTNQLSSGTPGSIDVKVNNFWAVRGITPSGRIEIQGNIDSPQATNGASTANASDLIITSGADSGERLIVTAPGLGQFKQGGIEFSLDVSKVTRSGLHTGLQYTLEANAAP